MELFWLSLGLCILLKLRVAATRKVGRAALMEDWAAIEAIFGAKTREAIVIVMESWRQKAAR